MLTINPLPQALGATVHGLDLTKPISAEIVTQLHAAWMENLVLFFPELHLNDEQHVALGEVFGSLAATSKSQDDARDHLTDGAILILDAARRQDRADTWHTDVTFTQTPPIGSLLAMKVSPKKGGDTLWSNQYAAYEALSEPVRSLIVTLNATHGSAQTGSAVHPLVITHPVTRRRALFVNRGWTRSIEGLSKVESDGILSMLFDHAEKPEFVVRWTWNEGDAALWDNRCTMHYAVNDYGDAARRLHRVTIYAR